MPKGSGTGRREGAGQKVAEGKMDKKAVRPQAGEVSLEGHGDAALSHPKRLGRKADDNHAGLWVPQVAVGPEAKKVHSVQGQAHVFVRRGATGTNIGLERAEGISGTTATIWGVAASLWRPPI